MMKISRGSTIVTDRQKIGTRHKSRTCLTSGEKLPRVTLCRSTNTLIPSLVCSSCPCAEMCPDLCGDGLISTRDFIVNTFVSTQNNASRHTVYLHTDETSQGVLAVSSSVRGRRFHYPSFLYSSFRTAVVHLNTV